MNRAYQFARGETIKLGIRVKTGTMTADMFDQAALKPANSDGTGPSEGGTETPLTGEFTAATGGDLANWILRAESADLAPGMYIADARFNVLGETKVARFVRVEILPSVTG